MRAIGVEALIQKISIETTTLILTSCMSRMQSPNGKKELIPLDLTNAQWIQVKEAVTSLVSKLDNISDKSIRKDILTINEVMFPASGSILNKGNALTTHELTTVMDEKKGDIKQCDHDASGNEASITITALLTRSVSLHKRRNTICLLLFCMSFYT